MSERPIIMSAESVRAILSGQKTQTRRVVQQFPAGGHVQELRDGTWEHSPDGGFDWGVTQAHCPFGQRGDRLWVREVAAWDPDFREPENIWYRADPKWDGPGSGYYPDNKNWRSPIHMPRWASRLTLEITSVRVERLQAITEEDARAEGMKAITKDDGRTVKYGVPDRDGLPGTDDAGWPWEAWHADPRVAFSRLWDDINAPRGAYERSWEDNPFVWVVEFKQVTP